MANPYRSYASSNSGGTNVTSLACNAPSGILAGDLLLALVTASTSATITPPTGWVAVTSSQFDGASANSQLFSRSASGSEPASYTFTLASAAIVGIAISDYVDVVVDAVGSPISGVVSGYAYPNYCPFTMPSVTTTIANQWVLGLAVVEPDGSGASAPYVPPTSSFAVGTVLVGALGQGANAAQGPVTPGTFTGTYFGLYNGSASDQGHYTAFSVSLKPNLSAPAAPTLTSPANASYLNASGSVTLGPATYNSTDGFSQNAYALRIKTSGASSYSYFNASTNALQSTIVWNSDSVPVGGTWSVTFPAGLVVNGNTYNWSMASQESGANLQGPFATDYTFTGQAPPTLVVDSPSGTVNGTTEPGVSWTNTLPSGAAQTNYQIIVESGTFSTTPGSGTVAWSSGVVSSSSTSATVGTPLTPAVTYRAFVQVTETGGELSAWAYSTFTLQVDAPATPVLTATPGNDPVTGAPMVTLAVQAIDNQLTADQASLESDATTGWAAGANTTIAASSAWAQDGTYSLALTATAAGTVSATTPTGSGGVPCTPGETVRAMASFHSATTARSCTVAISFYTSAGALISTSTSPSVFSGDSASPSVRLAMWGSKKWAQESVSGTVSSTGQGFVTAAAPASSAFMSVELNGANLNASEVLNADEILLGPGSSPTWTAGGFVGTTLVSLMFSDDNVNWFAVRNATSLSIPVATQQVSVIDYEGPLGFTRYYQAQVVSG